MRFFTSDQHLGHENILRYCGRPFADVSEMNSAILTRWRETVSPSDEVWVLGDVALGGDWQVHLAAVAELPGRKVLVPGNHDLCWPGRSKTRAARFEGPYRAAFAEIVAGPVRLMLGAVEVLVDHFPYADPARTVKDNYRQFRPVDTGMALLCGHIHERWRSKGRQVNVGVDVWDFRPVAEGELQALLSAADAAGSEGALPWSSAGEPR